MPTSLPAGFGDATTSGESSGSYTEIRGIFPAAIYKITPQSKERNNITEHNFSIDFRIDGGEFDGEDVNTYVALYARAIFTLHDILVALGELDTYYKKGEGDAKGQWIALPEESDLQGKRLYIQVDNAPWQSTDRETKVGIVDQNGQPVLRDGNAITGYYPINQPAPAYRPRPRKPRLAQVQPSSAGSQIPSVPGGFPGQVGAGTAAQDVWGNGPAQQGGSTGW